MFLLLKLAIVLVSWCMVVRRHADPKKLIVLYRTANGRDIQCPVLLLLHALASPLIVTCHGSTALPNLSVARLVGWRLPLINADADKTGVLLRQVKKTASCDLHRFGVCNPNHVFLCNCVFCAGVCECM
jgi:hypothetical protein